MLRCLPLVMLLAVVDVVPASEVGRDAELEMLVAWMTGSFSSQEQSIDDPDFFDIRLEVVPIWRDRTDASWLYVEQASAEALESPYRQRVYRVARNEDGRLESAVFELAEPEAFAGAWRSPERFETLDVSDLAPREGCSVLLERAEDSRFVGGVEGQGCRSSLRGAAWATSEVTIDADLLESWDRGFREDGLQAWGARKGPYLFRRVRVASDP